MNHANTFIDLRNKVENYFLVGALRFSQVSTIAMAFRQCLFETPEVTKIVLRNFMVSN